MPRSRNIKPSFFSNDDLADIDPVGRLLFIGLWTIADYKGDLEWRPKRIKAQVLPYDNCDIESLAINLDKSGFIRFYSVQGVKYVNIVNFTKHQNPHKNEKLKGSDIPEYSECTAEDPINTDIEINRDKNCTDQDKDGTDPADSCFLIPDSRSLIPDEIKLAFDRFWSSGIRKVGKKDAYQKFQRLLKNQKDPEAFVNLLINDIQWRLNNSQLGFAEMHPKTYLNGERWTDERRPNQPSYQPTSLASESERQTAIIQAKLAAGEFDQCSMGSNEPAIPAQMGESGGAEISGNAIDGEFYTLEQSNGGADW